MKKYNLSESLDRKYKTLAENINESETPCLKDISEEDDNKSLEFEKEQSFAEKAWDLNRIISDMNNEEVLEDWLYEWPDGCDFGDCQTYFDNEERYQELFDTFKRCYKAFHSDGLYSKDPEVVELAHKMDKELRLRPIVNYYKNLKEGAEGKRQQGFEFVIYLDEEPNKIIAIRSTGVEAEYYANKRNAGNDDSVSFERVPKGRFKVGDSFQGPFDDNWKLQESISGYKVVDNKGKEIKKGDKIVDFRDGTWMFDCITKVPGGSSNGKISVLENPNDKWSAREFYPSVFDLKIVKEVDECASCSSELMEEYNTQYDFEPSEELEYVFWDTFNSNKEDVANAEKYGLSFEYDSIEGPVWFGEWEDLNRFCNEYLGYELHPDFLFKKGKCNIVAIEDLSNKDFEDYYDKIYELAQGDNDYKPLFRKLRREASDRGL